jgi:hypothetical protein
LGVEKLERGHGNAVSENTLDRGTTRLHALVECRDNGARRRCRHQPEPNRGDDAERALRADEEALQVEARDVLAVGATNSEELARGDDGFQASDPVAGDAIFEGVRAVCIGCDVAADLRLLRRAWVGGKRRPFSRTRLRTSAVVRPASTLIRHTSGSNDRTSRRHSSDRTTPPAKGTAPAANPVPPPLGNDWHVVAIGPRHDVLDLARGSWEHERVGASPNSAELGRIRQVGGRYFLGDRCFTDDAPYCGLS